MCRRCRNRKTNEEFAVKIISRRCDPSREVHVLKLCQGHKNVVKLIEIISDDLHYYLVMELCRGGELLQRIRKKKSFTEHEASRIMRQLVEAAQFIHGKGVVHRDLKPENLLFESMADSAAVKIADFGFARQICGEKELTTPCFTLYYAAPEVLSQVSNLTSKGKEEKHGYDESCDLWSLGVILYTMLSGQVPFQHIDGTLAEASALNIMERIKKGDVTFPDSKWRHVSSAAKDFIKGLLTVDPKQRLTVLDALKHSWLNQTSEWNTCPRNPLMTPEVLGSRRKRSIELAVSATLNAFHKAVREGFVLRDVAHAPLAKRRKLKKDSEITGEDGIASGSKNRSPDRKMHLALFTT